MDERIAEHLAHPRDDLKTYLLEAELDGTRYTLRPGDIVFAGVGSVHGFWNEGGGRVRWLETQAPQPPARHAYRWWPSWERYARSRTDGGT